MRDKFKNVRQQAVELASKVKSEITDRALQAGDLNGDGKIDAEDARLAAAAAKEVASEAAESAVRLGKVAMQNDLAKDALTGAAIGAAIAIPLPLVGPTAGAIVGAGIGVYKNLTTKRSSSQAAAAEPATLDVHAEILKLAELRKQNLLSEQEFERQKRSVLARGRG